MTQSKRERYERKREQIKELAEAYELAAKGKHPGTDNWPFIHPEDAEAILAWCDAYDNEKAVVTPDNNGGDRWGDSRAVSTLKAWATSISEYSRELGEPMIDASTEELNEIAQSMYVGTAKTTTKDGGIAKGSARARQNSLKRFLKHYSEQSKADPDNLHIFDSEPSAVDPADMLTQEEFHAIRNAPEHPRDRAIVNLLLYTGQRNTAIRTIRIKDVDTDKGRYRLNSEADGLKGADKVGTWNPLLGATGAIKDWLNHHPDPDDGDAFLLCERRDSTVRDPHSTISGATVNRVLRKAVEVASQDYPEIKKKPTTAHAMRHNFVTMCKVVHDMDNDTIKRLIRHKPDSTVMETTYAHLSDEDYIEKAERAFGILEDEKSESPLSPDYCDTCREPLPPSAKSCPNCGTVFTPDAVGSEWDSYKDKVEALEQQLEMVTNLLGQNLDTEDLENPDLQKMLKEQSDISKLPEGVDL